LAAKDIHPGCSLFPCCPSHSKGHLIYFDAIFWSIATTGACTIAGSQGKTLVIDTKGLPLFIVHAVAISRTFIPLQNLSGSNNISSSTPPTGHRRQSQPLVHAPLPVANILDMPPLQTQPLLLSHHANCLGGDKTNSISSWSDLSSYCFDSVGVAGAELKVGGRHLFTHFAHFGSITTTTNSTSTLISSCQRFELK